MKLSTISFLFFVLLAAVISISNSGGRASAANAGNTGAPGDASATCITCHGTSAAIQVTLDIDITDASGFSIASAGYSPGETYDVTVRHNVSAGSPAGYGFQMVTLNGDEGVNAEEVSTWTNLGNNVKSAIATSTGRTYVEHNGISDVNEFMMEWTAPVDLSGPVTFYAGGNAVNRNGATSGDNADVTTLTISENITSSAEELFEKKLSVFPNPAKERLSLQLLQSTSLYDLRIYDFSGRLVKQQVIDTNIQGTTLDIDISKLHAGAYILQLNNDQEQMVKRVVKQ